MKMRTATAAGLVATLATACASTPEDADPAEFCAGFEQAFVAVADSEAPNSERLAALRDDIEALREVGTPADISQSALQGYFIVTEALLNLDDSENPDLLPGTDFSDPPGQDGQFNDLEATNAEAFEDYFDRTCTGGE